MYYIANARIPTEKAHGIQIMKMCEAFVGQGEKVRLIIPKRINEIKKDPFVFWGVEKKFEIKKLPCFDLVSYGKAGFLIQYFSFLISAKIYLLFKNKEIIYSRDFLTGVFFPNVILELHSLPKKTTNLHKRAYAKSKKIIVLTASMKKILVKEGVSENKILVAPDAVDLKKFNVSISKEEARKKLGLSLDKKIALYTGHLYNWKGANILAEAGQFLNDNILILFIGGTKGDIDSFSAQYTTPRIQVLGHKPYKEIPYWLKSADVLVLPNSGKEKISQFYTSPMKLFEYMASGVPIVASNLPSIREVLNTNNSVLVSPDNAREFSGGIKKVLQDSELSKKISRHAFEDVKAYTWQKRAENVLKFVL